MVETKKRAPTAAGKRALTKRSAQTGRFVSLSPGDAGAAVRKWSKSKVVDPERVVRSANAAQRLGPSVPKSRSQARSRMQSVSDRILERATLVFGSRDAAASWLMRPSRWLSGGVPGLLIHRKEGLKQVEEYLGQVEHGVYV